MTDDFGDAIAEYLADSVRLCEISAPDLQFRDNSANSSLLIEDLDISARFLRVSVDGPNVLHLKSIQVWGGEDRHPVDVGTGAKLSYSSIYPATERLIQRNLFTREHNSEYAFHTGHDSSPWVKLEFGASTRLSSIRIFNRTDAFSERAWKLHVEVSLDDLAWHAVYNYRTSEHFLDSALRHRRVHQSSTLPSQLKTCIDSVVKFAFMKEYDQSVIQLNELTGFKTSVKKDVAAAINNSLMLKRGVEWTNHGVKRTFRFWTNEEKRDYLNFSMSMVKILTELGYETCVGYGGVLAALRGVDLIPHDDDIDLLLLASRKQFPNIAIFMTRISTALSGAGYSVTGDYMAHRHASKNGVGIDLFFGFEQDGFVSWLPGPRRALQKEDVFPPLLSPFLGVELALPHNPFRYVEAVYGPEWRNPLPGWNHKWDNSEYIDWF